MIKLNKDRIDFFKSNWKLGIHLIFHTKYFGTNNEWWSSFPSTVLGDPTWEIIWNIVRVKPIIRNYRSMKFRAGILHFLTDSEYRKCFGKDKPV